MIISYASNAILSKARAMYGKRLTDKDYQSLVTCSSVAEVLSYLKSHTKYSALLNSISEKDVHRGRLELILKQQLFYDFASLCRYEISAGEHFSQYIIIRTEIEQILHYLMLFNSGKLNEYIYALPMYFDKHTKIDLNALSRTDNYEKFLTVLEGTPYHSILSKYKPDEHNNLDIPTIENSLYTYFYKKVFYIINNYTKGNTKKELNYIFNNYLDLCNFVRILRLKKYYNMTADKIKENLLPFGTLKDYQIDSMCNAPHSKDVFAIMESTSSGKVISNMEYNFAGEISKRGRYNLGRKNIRFSTSPTIVMMSYIFLEEAELSNVINIIEGVRYQVDEDTIKALLVYK